MGERRGPKALEAWCKRVTQGYPGVKVENMTTSWRDGLAFCALIHHFRPDLIDFESLSKSDVIGNNELAFKVAESHLGIPALLDAEDMAEYDVPDRLSILTYLSQFYQVFSSHNDSPGKKTADSDSSISSLMDSSSTPNMEGAPPWRELCVVCNNPVYLAQRLRVQGHLYHRTCFRCARCSAQLTLVDYYETVDGKFCCETCPDEVTIGQTLPEPVQDEDAGQDLPVSASRSKPPTPELSATTRQSIVAMRRMFFDTDDAKLNRYETLRTDLPPADIPISPNEEVKPSNVNSPLGDKTGDSPKQSSLELNSGVEYHNTSPSPSRRKLDDRSNYSSLNLDEVKEESKSPFDDSETTHDAPLAKSNSNGLLALSKTDGSESVTQVIESTDEQSSVSAENEPQVVASNPEIAISFKSPETFVTAENEESREISVLKLDTSNSSAADVKSELDESELLTADEHSRLSESRTTDFGESEVEKGLIVEAVNEFVAPPRAPKRRQKSPRPPPREIKPRLPPEEYPQDLNPFGDEDELEEPSAAGTNPFGSDSEEEFDVPRDASTPVTSPFKMAERTPSASPRSERRASDLSPVRRAPSLNPFEDSDEEEEAPSVPVPLPRKTAPSPEPMPFPRSALRASQRSIASTLSTSSRKKRPAPPPPTQATPSSPTLTIKSTRSRKTRRAPLPPGMASSRLSLASDTVSLAGDTTFTSTDVPVQISAVVDRISEWVEHAQLETSYDTIPSANDSHPQIDDSFGDVTQSTPKKVAKPVHPGQPLPVPTIQLNDVKESDDAKTCHVEVPKAETIAQTPSSSPVKTKSPSDSLSDNKNNSLLRISIQEYELSHERYQEEENIKNARDKRKSLPEHSDGLTDKSPKTAPPLPLEPTISILNGSSNTVGYTDSDVEDRLYTNKKNKDDANMTRKISGSSSSGSSYSLHKSAHGQWRRKTKAPAPPLPLNADRAIKKDLPLLKIKQELNDIEIKQQGLERQGVALEARIRDKFDSGASITPYVEELVLQLFELVNEKNELFRKQAELMYMRRQQHLEEEQASLEKEIRDLMSQPEANKTDSDKEMEEQLILRLIEVVERRDAIVQCLEMDRIREAEEDRSITARLNIFTQAMAPEDKTATSPKKKSHSDGGKKKWYTLNRSKKPHV